MDVFFASVTGGRGQEMISTTLLRRTVPSRVRTEGMTVSFSGQWPTRDPQVAGRVIFHLLYREGSSIASPEPLIRPQSAGPLDAARYGGNPGHAQVAANPADIVQFSKYYVGYTTEFWERVRTHGDRFSRLFVVYYNAMLTESARRLEPLLIEFTKASHIPTRSGRTLVSDNADGGKPHGHEFVYLAFA